jgi:hypothetical protein
MRSMGGGRITDCYHGHPGVLALYADMDDALEDWWWTIRSVVDGGDRLAVRADFVGYGRGSGAKTELRRRRDGREAFESRQGVCPQRRVL